MVMVSDVVMDINGRHSDPIHCPTPYWVEFCFAWFELLTAVAGETDRAANFELTPRAAQEIQSPQEPEHA